MMEHLDLQAIRDQLDRIDSRLVQLFEERMALCRDVAEFKITTGKPVYDGERERQKLEAVRDQAQSSFNRQGVYELFTQLMTMSRKYQYGILAEHGMHPDMGFTMVEDLKKDGVKIVYQGVEGAYSHCAALQYFGQEADVYHVSHFEEALIEVEEGRADYAVLPIENSSAGAVSDNYDNLVKHKLYIVAETHVAVKHCLLGLPGAEISDIRQVFSHPQALLQSARYLDRHREWRQISAVNTAVAAKQVLEGKDASHAAVASEMSAKLYGLQVLEREINHNKNNVTRFLVLAREPVYRKDAGKVSICFEGLHKSGSLYHMLGNFIYNDINMVMIQSRPIEGRSWEYRFFVDVEGSLSDGGIQNALTGISAEAVSMRILGNY